AKAIDADWLVYQDMEDLIEAVQKGNESIKHFDCSCFNNEYVTGDVSAEYLARIENLRNDSAKQQQDHEESEDISKDSTIIEMHNSA
ncbi:MAG: amidophosphoribosyltransferase, partial [Gammaproteobacteria bacterium]|nr:amidophosphoribosyltransferase [Gammaproteobacteria bacterium]